ncbi:MAG: hypothetical protein E7645_05110 [Ruminococcaceae bacterium]|nr:hypothetical protein [Oscillospiraceae bacterium]
MAFNRNDKKKDGKGCLFLIIGSLVGVLLLGLFIILTGQLTSVMVNATMAGTVGYVMLTATESCIMVASLLLFAVLVIHYLPDPEDMSKGQKPLTPTPPKPAKKILGAKPVIWLATLGLLVCVAITAFVSATTYRAITEDGISHRFCQLIETNKYEWKQVSSYRVDCDEEKGLSVTLTMRDGQKFEILQSSISAPRSFHETYECKEAFVADLLEMLRTEYQITPNVSHIERARAFYQGDEKLWPYVKDILGYDELFPEGEEIPETSTNGTSAEDTSAMTEPSATE